MYLTSGVKGKHIYTHEKLFELLVVKKEMHERRNTQGFERE